MKNTRLWRFLSPGASLIAEKNWLWIGVIMLHIALIVSIPMRFMNEFYWGHFAKDYIWRGGDWFWFVVFANRILTYAWFIVTMVVLRFVIASRKSILPATSTKNIWWFQVWSIVCTLAAFTFATLPIYNNYTSQEGFWLKQQATFMKSITDSEIFNKIVSSSTIRFSPEHGTADILIENTNLNYHLEEITSADMNENYQQKIYKIVYKDASWNISTLYVKGDIVENKILKMISRTSTWKIIDHYGEWDPKDLLHALDSQYFWTMWEEDFLWVVWGEVDTQKILLSE